MHALATFWLLAAGTAATATTTVTGSSGGGGSILALIAFGLLVASLVVFIVSTRQWPLLQRALIWGLGAALLGASICVSGDVGGGRFLKVLGALLKSEKILANLEYIRGYFEPALNVLFVLSVIVAAVALIAFTPGEGIERNLRRFSLVVSGIIVGSTLTLGLVALGFGGNAKRTVFVGILTEEDVIDGDTIRMGDVSLRIVGIEAAEIASEEERASDPARRHLSEMVAGKVVVCTRPRHRKGKQKEGDQEQKLAAESFGRPVVECFLTGDSGANLGPAMVRDGCAIACRKGSPNQPHWEDLVTATEQATDACGGTSKSNLVCPKGFEPARSQ